MPAQNAGYTISLQLFDGDGRRVAQADGEPFAGALPVSRWEAGRTYEDTRTLALPALQPGVYELRASAYDSASHAPAGDQQLIARLAYLPAAKPIPLDAIADAGWRLSSAAVSDSGVVLTGEVTATPSRGFTWFVHVLDASDRILSQDDHPPLAPMATWQPDDVIAEPFRVTIPANATRLEIGAYDAAGQRVPMAVAGNQQDVISVPLAR
jgi:hypothetical protein